MGWGKVRNNRVEMRLMSRVCAGGETIGLLLQIGGVSVWIFWRDALLEVLHGTIRSNPAASPIGNASHRFQASFQSETTSGETVDKPLDEQWMSSGRGPIKRWQSRWVCCGNRVVPRLKSNLGRPDRRRRQCRFGAPIAVTRKSA